MSKTKAEPFDAYHGILHACRAAIVRDLSDSPCHDQVVRYADRGKMLRPLLVFAAASAFGADLSKGLVGARAIELLHTASLIHDDIVDGAEERRGLPAMHVQLGVEQALVIGDYLLLRSLTLVAQDGSIDKATSLQILATLASHAGECCRGQSRELAHCEGADLEDEYLAIARAKTGSQFAAAAAVGGISADADDHEVDALQQYGANLGIAFQIEDDIADLARDSRALENSPASSQAHRRPTLPLIYLHRACPPTPRAEFWGNQKEWAARVPPLRPEEILQAVRAKQASFVEAALSALVGIHHLDDCVALQLLPSHVLEASRRKQEATKWA